MTLRIGLLGCGRIGKVHATTISSLKSASLVAVADAMPDAANALASEHNAEVRDADAILTASDIDAVIIGTPTTTHFDFIHAATKSGKAIFCEKPIDLDTKRVEACVATVEAARIPFMTAFNRRFDTNFAAVQAKLADGAIGKPELVIITSRDPAPPPIGYIKTSGGLFRDMMIHDLDLARFLLSEEPTSVFATGSCQVDPAIGEAGDVDTAAVTLTTASGTICQITNSRRASYGYDQRIEVHGENGMLSAANVHETTVEQATDNGFTRSPAKHFFLERYEAAYRAEMVHFVECVAAGQPCSPTVRDGLAAQRLADAAQQSHDAGRVIDLR